MYEVVEIAGKIEIFEIVVISKIGNISQIV